MKWLLMLLLLTGCSHEQEDSKPDFDYVLAAVEA